MEKKIMFLIRPDRIATGKRGLLCLLKESVQASLLEKLAALHEALEAPGQALHDVVYAAALVDQSGSQILEKASFARL